MTTATAIQDHGTRKELEGWVVSDKMEKTRVVEIRWQKRHRVYEKVLRMTTKVYAHDEKNESKTGDKVRVMETRPLSRSKRWRVTEILEKSKI